MSRIFSSVLDLLDDVGRGVAVLVTALVAGAVGVVATLQVTGGTPYSQEDLERRSAAYEVQSDSGQAPAPASDEDDPAATAELTGLQEDLEEARERADRVQRQSEAWEDKWTAAQRRITELREQIAGLGEVDPVDAPAGAGGLPDGAPEPGDTETTVTGTLTTTWTLSEAAKPWPAACGIPQDSYAVKVLGADGESVATGSVTGSNLVKRKEKKGVLTLVCTLSYQAVLPLPAKSNYEFQAVSTASPGTPLYSAVVPGPVATRGSAPSLVVSLTR